MFQLLEKIMNTAHNICNAMRDCGSLSHSDIEDVLACLASTLQRSDLSSRCITVVVDMVDEMTGKVQDNFANEQAETEWNKRQGRRIPGFDRVYAELDALTIRVVP
jgi:hypothetical protein